MTFIFYCFNLSVKGIVHAHLTHTVQSLMWQRFARASLCKIKNITHKQSFFKNAIDNIRYLKYHKDIKNNASHNHARQPRNKERQRTGGNHVTTNRVTFGKRWRRLLDLKELRMTKMITQKQLADIVGVERATIGNIENKVSQPSIKTAMALGKYFNVDWRGFFEEAN